MSRREQLQELAGAVPQDQGMTSPLTPAEISGQFRQAFQLRSLSLPVTGQVRQGVTPWLRHCVPVW